MCARSVQCIQIILADLTQNSQHVCVCVAEFTIGYFSEGLLWPVALITDDKNVTLSNDTHWQDVIHIRCQQGCQSSTRKLCERPFASGERMF